MKSIAIVAISGFLIWVYFILLIATNQVEDKQQAHETRIQYLERMLESKAYKK